MINVLQLSHEFRIGQKAKERIVPVLGKGYLIPINRLSNRGGFFLTKLTL